MATIKSCGKTHSYCRICRPEIAAKVGGIVDSFKVKSCGKEHAYCNICSPAVGRKISHKRKGQPSPNRGKKYPGTGYWGGRTLPEEMRKKISLTVSKSLLGNTRAKGFRHSKATKLACKTRMTQRMKNHPITFTPELRERIAIGVSRAHERGEYKNNITNLEYALSHVLQSADLSYEYGIRFGRYVVDFYVESHKLVFEADGMFWDHHKDVEREQTRDLYLVSNHDIYGVIHLKDEDLDGWTLPKQKKQNRKDNDK